MSELCLKIVDNDKKIIASKFGEKEVNLVYYGVYEEGTRIVLEMSEKNTFYWVKLDDAVDKALLYITGNVEYIIPFGEKRINISPKAYTGDKHVLNVRKAYSFELEGYQKLSFNPYDQHGEVTAFPHASANVETRGESVFAAMNAIDGYTVSHSHGEWPFESWGINQNPNAVFRLDFGRKVEANRLVLYTRADYPHDNWWEKVTIRFSDGSKMVLDLVKTGEAQIFEFEKSYIEWLELGELIKADDPSPFPALTQIEVYGKCKKN